MLGAVDWFAILQREVGVIENILNLKLAIDRVAVDELEEMAKKTLATFNQDKPSSAKTAGNVAFWIKKLKPVSRAPDSLNDYRLVNELLAVMVGLGICNLHYVGTSKQVSLNRQTLNDLASSLRYHSYSPNSIAMIFEALMH